MIFNWFFKPGMLRDFSSTYNLLKVAESKLARARNIDERKITRALHYLERIRKDIKHMKTEFIELKKELNGLMTFIESTNEWKSTNHVIFREITYKLGTLYAIVNDFKIRSNDLYTKQFALFTRSTKVKTHVSTRKILAPVAIVDDLFLQDIITTIEAGRSDVALENLQNFTKAFRDLKIKMNEFYYEFLLVRKFKKNYDNGKRGADLLEATFGKRPKYEKEEHYEVSSSFLNEMLHYMSENQFNLFMHKLRLKLTTRSWFLRGLSNKEAEIFYNRFRDLAKSVGVSWDRDKKEVNGFGILHAKEHEDEILMITKPSNKTFEEQMKVTYFKPTYIFKSGHCYVHIKKISRGIYGVVVADPSDSLITFHHADDTNSRDKSVIRLIGRALQSRTLNSYEGRDGSIYVPLKQNREYLELQKGDKFRFEVKNYAQIKDNLTSKPGPNKVPEWFQKGRFRKRWELHLDRFAA